MARYSDAFGAKVREAMDSRGLSQSEIARRAQDGISQRSVGEMRRGLLVSTDLIVSFAEATVPESTEAAKLANELLDLADRRNVRYWTGDAARVMRSVVRGYAPRDTALIG